MKKLPLLVLTAMIIAACTHQQKTETEIQYHDAVYGYSETVTVVEGSSQTIYISGQVGEGATLDEQMRNALKNLKKQLEKHNADYTNLIKINTYIVDYQPEDLDVFRGVRKEIFGEDIVPASTLVGVQALALPEWKIEIDAVAIVVKD